MNPKLTQLVVLISFVCFGQQQDLSNSIKKEIDPLRPAKAAFYSAVLPGLGQVYNKRYWKLPLIYGGLGASIYYYDLNNKNFKRYRNAYKRRLSGFSDDEFQGIISDNNRLIDGMNFYKQYRDQSMLFIIGTYFLNILDANIDAHLKQYNINQNLSLKAYMDQNPVVADHHFGMSLNFNF
ncbi:MAG: DUF5683 domain-containing protein [Flavobacteriaceae bacterium]|nr:DUF5683 domain-containing protein [Flavobacteriaceae bacterium]